MNTSIQRTEHHHLIRERTFTVSRPSVETIAGIIDNLCGEHMTGQVLINMSQGTIANVQVKESTRISLT